MEVELELVSTHKSFDDMISNNSEYNRFIYIMGILKYYHIKQLNPVIIRESTISNPITLDIFNGGSSVFLNRVINCKAIDINYKFKLYKIKLDSKTLEIFPDRKTFISKCLEPLLKYCSISSILININGYCSYFDKMDCCYNLSSFICESSNKYNILLVDSCLNKNISHNINPSIIFEGSHENWIKKIIKTLPPADRFNTLNMDDINKMINEYVGDSMSYLLSIRPDIIPKPWHPVNYEWMPRINIQLEGEIIVEDASTEPAPESNINLSSISAELDYTKKMLERSEHLRKADRDVSEKIINQINPFLNKKIVLPPFEKL